MKIVYVEAGKKAEVRESDLKLETMQKLVGGLIQAIYPFSDYVAIICNDEGKLMGLPLNRGLTHPETGELYDIIAGNFFVCGIQADSDDFSSLTDEQVKTYTELFKYPEIFMKKDDNIISIKI